VWIFGGGFYSGAISLWLYDARALAAFGDVIVTSLNYRVGTFGFLSTGDGRIKGGHRPTVVSQRHNVALGHLSLASLLGRSIEYQLRLG